MLLNVDLTESLIKEGLAKDIIRRIQSMRKDFELKYDAEIELVMHSKDKLIEESISEFKALIISETLSKDLEISKTLLKGNSAKNWEISTATGEKDSLMIQIKS